MYHLIFIVKIKNNMKVCILGNGLISLTLAKALVNQNIYVDTLIKKNINLSTTEQLVFQKVILNFLIKI